MSSLTLIIPAFNEEKGIGQALKSIDSQVLPPDLSLHVLLVPNGCTDSTVYQAEQTIDELQNDKINWEIRALSDGHKGKALNYGRSIATSEIQMYMDGDCRLAPNTVSLLHQALTVESNLVVAGALDIPVFEEFQKGTLLYEYQVVQQLRREERGRVLPVGRAIAFKSSMVPFFPTDIHSEDTWIALVSARDHGWDCVKVLMEAVVYFAPALNWLDYLKQEARWDRGYLQLMEKFPELKITYDERRKSFRIDVDWGQIDSRVRSRLADAGIDPQRLEEHRTIIDKIIEETSDAIPGLVSKEGKWEAIRSTKRII